VRVDFNRHRLDLRAEGGVVLHQIVDGIHGSPFHDFDVSLVVGTKAALLALATLYGPPRAAVDTAPLDLAVMTQLDGGSNQER
jgi:hypothetical protein